MICRTWQAAGFVLAGVLILGLASQFIRDKAIFFLALMHIPLVPLGLLAVGYDLIRRGRSLSRLRFSLMALGLVAFFTSALTLFGRTHSPSRSAVGEGVRLLHWNVRWGGTGEAGWRNLSSDVVSRRPDVVVLSEAPGGQRVRQLADELGPGWSVAEWEHEPHSRYTFRLAVLSRWPLQVEKREKITDGRAMTVAADAGGAPFRLLVVDAESALFRDRTPRLVDVMNSCRRSDEAGRPVDLIAGDFNTIGRVQGFDGFRGAGYSLAAESSGGWRGTWPAWCPLYDIDHVWVGPRMRVVGCDLFTNGATDHRGQVVRLVRAAGG